MALLKEDYLRNIARIKIRNDHRYNSYNTDTVTKSLLESSSKNFSETKSYDIFLSHSYLDKEIILGLSIELESYGYKVYVDWIKDSYLDRSSVSKENVMLIKQRMKASRCLLFATSSNSSNSKWMPWELGFMDGFRDKVAILPISEASKYNYKGTEYLSIYPFIDKEVQQNLGRAKLWVTDQDNNQRYIPFEFWIEGQSLIIHN